MNPPAPATPAVRAVCLAGPTASGKTAAALALAAQLPIEIISMDSALVYRGMDIGTAKPSAAERASVPHHLIDIVDPAQPYSAARFAADAHELINDIRSRGRLPLLVGGTMLYFKALRDGLDAMPPADPAVRAQLDAEAAASGWPALHAQLAQVDPTTAARLPPNDAQRVQRALEVWRVSGRALSSWQQGAGAGPRAPDTLPLVALVPQSRAWLHARIAERFDAMLAAGLVAEVRALRARGDLQAETPSMRCVGYRQVWDALDSGYGGVDEDSSKSTINSALKNAIKSKRDNTTQSATGDDTAGLRDKGIAATRQLAKRQLTWLRSLQPQATVACDAPDALGRVATALAEAFGAAQTGAWRGAVRTSAGQ